MRERSSNSVRIVFADKEGILLLLRDYAEQLRQTRSEVEKIGYFGSYATGTYGPASDVDLLVILRQSDKRFIDRIPDYLPTNLSVCCDVFPYSSDEVRRMQQEDSPWIRHILDEVVWL